jgi:hypothetical protein
MQQKIQNGTIRGEAAISQDHIASQKSPTSYVVRLSARSQERIQARIMKTNGRFLKTAGFEWRSYYHEAFDAFARELLKGAFELEVLLGEVIPQLIFDEAIRLKWPVYFATTAPDEICTVRYGSYWTNPDRLLLFKRMLKGPAEQWRGKTLLRYGNPDAPAASAGTSDQVVPSRAELLAEYKQRTGVRTNAAIYNAKNSGVHKAEFYSWRSGKLLATSATAISLENFLRAGERPKPRRIRD